MKYERIAFYIWDIQNIIRGLLISIWRKNLSNGKVYNESDKFWLKCLHKKIKLINLLVSGLTFLIEIFLSVFPLFFFWILFFNEKKLCSFKEQPWT